MQDMTYIIKPERPLEEFMRQENTLTGVWVGERIGALGEIGVSNEEDTQAEIAFKIKGLITQRRDVQFKTSSLSISKSKLLVQFPLSPQKSKQRLSQHRNKKGKIYVIWARP